MVVQLGDTARGLELYGQALEAATEAGDDERAMRAHGNLAIVHRMDERLADAVTHLEAAVQLAVKSSDVFMEGRGCLDLSATLRLKGELVPALEAARRALTISAQLDDDEASGECSTRIAAILMDLQRHSEAIPKLQSAMDVWSGLCEAMHDALVEARISGE